MLVLRKELNAVGGNFNQAVHSLHTLHIVPEIQHWTLINEQDKIYLYRSSKPIQQSKRCL
jgi:hypothetical protein